MPCRRTMYCVVVNNNMNCRCNVLKRNEITIFHFCGVTHFRVFLNSRSWVGLLAWSVRSVSEQWLALMFPSSRLQVLRMHTSTENTSIHAFFRGQLTPWDDWLITEVSWSGCKHDAHVFRNSAICEASDASRFVPGNPAIMLSRVNVPPLRIADDAYPIRKWLMKPMGGHGDRCWSTFDYRLFGVWNMVECAFERLKAKWRSLGACRPVAIENVVSVVDWLCHFTRCVWGEGAPYNSSGIIILHSLPHPPPPQMLAPQPGIGRRVTLLEMLLLIALCMVSD